MIALMLYCLGIAVAATIQNKAPICDMTMLKKKDVRLIYNPINVSFSSRFIIYLFESVETFRHP